MGKNNMCLITLQTGQLVKSGNIPVLGWSMTPWKILKINKTHLHKFKYVLSKFMMQIWRKLDYV